MRDDEGTRQRVTRLLPVPPDLVRREAVRRDLTRLAALDHPGLAAVAQIRPVPGGFEVVYVVPAQAAPLADRPVVGLTPAAAAGVLVPVLGAVAAVHAGGLVHGAIGPSDVLVCPAADGSPGPGLLLGAARPTDGPGGGGRADDVCALGELCAAVLAEHSVPARLAHLLVRAADPDPLVRPTADELADGLADAARWSAAEPTPPRSRPAGPAGPPTGGPAPGAGGPQLPASPLAARRAVGGPYDEPLLSRSVSPGPGRARHDDDRPRPSLRRVPFPATAVRPRPGGPGFEPPAGSRAAAGPGRRAPGGRTTGPASRRDRVGGWRRVGIPLALAAAVLLGVVGLRSVGAGLDPSSAAAVAGPGPSSPAVPTPAPAPTGEPADPAPPLGSPVGTEVAPRPVSLGPSGGGSVPGGDPSGPTGGPRPDGSADPVAAPSTLAPPAASGVGEQPARTSGPPDWSAVLTALDRARLQAFATADPTLLHQVDLPGSPAWRRDEATLRDLSARDVRVHGANTQVRSVRVSSRTGSRVILLVMDRRSGYQIVDALTSVVVSTHPSAPVRRWRVTLQQQPEGWRVVDAVIAAS